MPTRVFTCSADAVVVKDPNGVSLGAGREGHLNVGYMAGGYIARTLLKFNLDFSGMYSITAARLRLRTTGNPSAHGAKTTGNFYIQRITSSWSEGTRGGESWWTDNAVEWDNQPSRTATGQYENDWSGNYSSWDEYTITNLVKAWAPTSIGGSGLTNYGIAMRMVSETSGNHAEYYDRYSYPSYAAEIEVDYTDAPSNSAPTVTRVTNGLTTIINPDELIDPQSNSLVGAWAPKTAITFTYNDADNQNMSKYQIVVYDASSGGNTLYDSGEIVMSASPGQSIQHSLPLALGSGTSYYYTVKVWDSFSTPASNADAATRTEFHARYGSWIGFIDLLETGVTEATVTVTPATTQAGTQRVIFYAGSDKVSNWTGWKRTASEALASGYRYFQIGIRLATYTSGTNPSVDKIEASWLAAGDAPLPDRWLFASLGGEVSIDNTVRRYGSKSLKVTDAWGTTTIKADTGVGDGLIAVTPNTDYVLAAEIKTSGMLRRVEWEAMKDACIGLAVWDGDGNVLHGNPSYAEAADQTMGTVDDTYEEVIFADAKVFGTDLWGGNYGTWSGVEWGNGGIPAHSYGDGYFYTKNYTTDFYCGGVRYTDIEVPCVPGEVYEVVCVATAPAGQGFKLGAQFHDANDNWVGSPVITEVIATGSWQVVKGTVTAPAGAAFINPIFMLELNGQSGNFWMGAGMFTYRRVREPVNLWPEGFKRLRLNFRTGAEETRIRPGIAFITNGGYHNFWVDGVSLTEGKVAPPWSQGTVSPAGTVAAMGATLDASTGAIFRMRGSNGGVRDVVELGTSGMVFGGDAQITSPSAGKIAVPGLIVNAQDGTNEGGEINLLGAGSYDDWNVDIYQAAFRLHSEGAVILQMDKADHYLTVEGGAGFINAKKPIRRVYTGNDTWTKPAGLSHIEVEVVGGGGAGGGAPSNAASNSSVGGGGGGGGYAKKLFTAADLASLSTATVTVGASRAGTSGADGGDGNTSSFAGTGITTVQATGGTGGTAATSGTTLIARAGGSGGVGSGGDINARGGTGAVGMRLSATYASGGGGGNTIYGGGGIPQTTTSAGANTGVAGYAYGGGGGGASSNNGGGAASGGAGAAGVVIVTEYYAS